MSEPHAIVVGGGISGMTFAHHCARAEREVVVLEREAHPGGCLQSHRTPGGFWFELGAHTCYNSYTQLLGVLEARLGLGALLPREKVPFRLLSDGQVRSIAKELRFFELARSVPRAFRAKKAGSTVRGYYGRIVGRRNYDRVFGPLFSAVPSQPADDFPAEMLFKKRERRKDVLRSFTLEGGLQTIVDRIADDARVKVETGAEVVAVSREGDRFAAHLADGRTFRAAHLVMAAPPPAGAKLLQDLAPEVSAALARMRHARVRSLGVVVRKADLQLEPVAGIIPIGEGRFYSAVSRDVVPDAEYRGFTFHFHPDVAAEEGFHEIARVLGVDPSRLSERAVREVVLPSPTLGHGELVQAIDRAIAGTRLYVTGNYFGGLSIEDCVIRSGQEYGRMAAGT